MPNIRLRLIALARAPFSRSGGDQPSSREASATRASSSGHEGASSTNEAEAEGSEEERRWVVTVAAS